MSKSNVRKESSKKTIGLHLPRISLPRDSFQVRREDSRTGSLLSNGTESADTIPAPGATFSTLLTSVKEKLPPVISNTLEESESEHVSNKSATQVPVATTVNVTTTLNALDPGNDISIVQVMSDMKPRRSFVTSYHGGTKKSLLENVLAAKTAENDKIRKSFQDSTTRAKRRWKMTRQALQQAPTKEQLAKLKVGKRQTVLEGASSRDELSQLAIDTKSDVEGLELHDQNERTPNSRGLKTLAKIFNKDRGSVSDTPTIFALLKASHIVSVAVVTHQQRESQEDELTAYEQTLNNHLAFLPDLSIVNTIRPQSKSLEEFEGVAMFADVSGFTVLCATYGTVNISKLKEILNLVMGNIVDEILMSGGDIVSFAGDAIFAVWRTHSIEERASILPKILKCSIHIQDAVNLTVDKSITLRVKVGLAVGKMFAFYLQANSRDHLAVVGPAVKDVNKAEGCCVAGNIVCSQQFFDEFPQKERYPLQSSKPGYVQLWPPKNNAKQQVLTLLENLGNGNHVTLDRYKVVRKLADDLVKQDLLKRYIPDYLRFQLQEGQGTSWASQVRTITTLFISLVFGDSEKVSSEHENVQDALICIDEIVDKMNGTVNKIFTFDKGCTILVAFGTQGSKMNDDPRRALKTAQMILPSLQNKVTDFQGVSIGVTTGLCFCGVVGHEDRHEYTVIGHQVNLACRLMSNYPFCVACDESTKKLSTLPDSAFTALPPKVLKGVPPGGLYFKYSDPMDTEERLYKGRASLAVSVDNRPLKIIGRAREMDALYASMVELDNNEAGKGQNVIIIEAQAGFGKTRLLDQYVIIGERRNFEVIFVPLVMDEMTTPFFAVKMVMFKLLELGKPTNFRNKEGVIARYVPEYLRSDMCLLNDILGTKFKRDSTRDYSYKNLHRFLKVLLKEIVGDRSYLFIIDNAWYMDQQSWEFLYHLMSIKKKIILTLSMRRTSHKLSRAESNLLSSARTKKFSLQAFNQDEVEEFSKSLLNVRNVPEQLVKILTEKTRGIPQYCEGLLRKMVKEQVVKVVDDMEAYKARRSVPRPRDSRSQSFAKRFSIFSQSSTAHANARTSLIRKKIVEEDSDEEEEDSGSLPGAEEPSLCCASLLPCSGHKDQANTNIDQKKLFEDLIETVDSTKICVLNESVDLSKVALPDSLKELFLAQFDRLAVTEQVTMKCCAVLGTHFSLSLLKQVLPHRTSAQINHSVRIMMREQLLECGAGLGLENECNNKYCPKLGKILLTGDPENVSICETIRFSTQFSAEILRELLLPEQRIRIHETAARALEKRILNYDFCCKKEFFGNVFKIRAMGETVEPDWVRKGRGRRLSLDSSESKACQCHTMFTTIYPQIIRHFKAAGTNHSLFEALCSAGALGMALSFTFEAITYLEDALLLFKTRTKLNDTHRACLSSLLCLALYLCPTPTTIRLYKEAIHLGGHAQVIYKYNVSCLSYLCGSTERSETSM